MSKNLQTPDAPQKAANQNNQMSDDPRDGHRLTDNPAQHDTSVAEKAPQQDRQDQETISAFGQRGVTDDGGQDG